MESRPLGLGGGPFPQPWSSTVPQVFILNLLSANTRLTWELFPPEEWDVITWKVKVGSIPSNPKIPGVYIFVLAYRMKTSSIVVTEAPKPAMPSSSCLSSKSVNRNSNLRWKNSFIPQRWKVNPSLSPLAFYRGKSMGYGVENIFVQISTLSLSSFMTLNLNNEHNSIYFKNFL